MSDGRPRPVPLSEEYEWSSPSRAGDASERDVSVRNTFVEVSAGMSPHSADLQLRAERGLTTAPAALHQLGTIQISLAAATQSPNAQGGRLSSKLSRHATPFTPSKICEGLQTPTTTCATPSTPSREDQWTPAMSDATRTPLVWQPSDGLMSDTPAMGRVYSTPPRFPPSVAPETSVPPPPPRSSDQLATSPASVVADDEDPISSTRRAAWADLTDDDANEETGGLARELLQVARPHARRGATAGGSPNVSTRAVAGAVHAPGGVALSFPPPQKATAPAVPPPPLEPPRLPPGVLSTMPLAASPTAVTCSGNMARPQQAVSAEQIFACVANAPAPKFAPPSLPAPMAAAAPQLNAMWKDGMMVRAPVAPVWAPPVQQAVQAGGLWACRQIGRAHV